MTYDSEFDKYRNVEMWFICPTCSKGFEVDEPDNYCEHYKENDVDDEKTIIKYTAKQIQTMQTKFISNNYSPSWMRTHFVEMMRYIKWLNGKE
jgi:hypothetical protein